MAKQAKSARDMISERVQENRKKGGMYERTQKVREYVCLDTGMPFRVLGEQAQFSPFTGKKNFREAEDFMQMTDIPSNQKDPMTQKPLSDNPVPPENLSGWDNSPWSANPAPDQGSQGDVEANGDGYLKYPQSSVPPYVTKQPNDRTDNAPAGSK